VTIFAEAEQTGKQQGMLLAHAAADVGATPSPLHSLLLLLLLCSANACEFAGCCTDVTTCCIAAHDNSHLTGNSSLVLHRLAKKTNLGQEQPPSTQFIPIAMFGMPTLCQLWAPGSS